METEAKVGSDDIGLGGVLFVTFLVLKLTGVISWSWWWVTAPLWIPVALVVGILLLVAIIGGIVAILSK